MADFDVRVDIAFDAPVTGTALIEAVGIVADDAQHDIYPHCMRFDDGMTCFLGQSSPRPEHNFIVAESVGILAIDAGRSYLQLVVMNRQWPIEGDRYIATSSTRTIAEHFARLVQTEALEISRRFQPEAPWRQKIEVCMLPGCRKPLENRHGLLWCERHLGDPPHAPAWIEVYPVKP